MKLFRIGILFAFISISGSVVVTHPEWLAENKFLLGFVSHEIVAVLVVILTITFASVANIHLSLNRVLGKNKGRHDNQIDTIRQKINADAWMIFWAFLVCVIALIFKGSFGSNIFVVAAVHAVALIVLLINFLVLHTIYRSVFAIVAAERLLTESSEPSAERRQDFTDESPPTQ